jgi:CBS domain-containing protein
MTNRRIAEMVRNKNPVCMPATATVKKACQSMRDRCVGAVLVTDRRKRLIGIFTGRDAVVRMLAEGREPATTRLSEVMTASPSTLSPDKAAVDALRLMRDGAFRHVPVVEDGQVVSCISRGDFRALEQAQLDEETGIWERI